MCKRGMEIDWSGRWRVIESVAPQSGMESMESLCRGEAREAAGFCFSAAGCSRQPSSRGLMIARGPGIDERPDLDLRTASPVACVRPQLCYKAWPRIEELAANTHPKRQQL